MFSIFNKRAKTNNVFEGLNPKNAIHVCLVANENGDPCVRFLFADCKTVKAPIIKSFDVHWCNEFLRSMETGIDVTFITYMQYSDLLDEISSVLKGGIFCECN